MWVRTRWLPLFLLLILPAISNSNLWAQNPVPFVNQPLVPTSVPPGGPSFTLTVNGAGFVSGSVVRWNGGALTPQFVSGTRLTATVPAATPLKLCRSAACLLAYVLGAAQSKQRG